MGLTLIPGGRYTRKELWGMLHPNRPYPTGGNWSTGYVLEGDSLFVFANIGIAGRTGHDFPNTLDHKSKTMVWYGKPNSHSGQPTFQRLLSQTIRIEMFARWDNTNTAFTYLGSPSIRSHDDSVPVEKNSFAIRLILSFDEDTKEEPPPPETSINGLEGKLTTVSVNRYERNPELRARCIDFHGCICKICSFDFEQLYGWLGKGYCHVHHITPLSEVASEHYVDPKADMIPVCANCHAMLHRQHPPLTPEELRRIVNRNDGQP